MSLNLSSSSALREQMITYIRKHFGELLGSHVELLEQQGGLDEIARLIREGHLGKLHD